MPKGNYGIKATPLQPKENRCRGPCGKRRGLPGQTKECLPMKRRRIIGACFAWFCPHSFEKTDIFIFMRETAEGEKP